MQFDKYMEANRLNWEDRVDAHTAGPNESYDIDAFLAGESTLLDVELEELGDVSGKRLLHLMCHFGMDTLCLWRLGARVTGVDFSEKAIGWAKKLAQKIESDAEFICANVYELPSQLCGKFDIVYISYGVLCWLPDIDRLMDIAARCLKPGGLFCLIDGHPLIQMYEYDPQKKDLHICYPYFYSESPMEEIATASYANASHSLQNQRTYEWSHDLGGVVNAAIRAGLRVASLQEYPFGFWQRYPHMVRDEKGHWLLPEDSPSLPIMYSLTARKEE
ncbi:MAG: class I SAM-dependent methyltransferase [Candidatus Sumerlaeia bacterium]